jgi:hypothetical protein
MLKHILNYMFRPPGKLDFVDHVVGNQADQGMVPVADWYV